MDEGELQHWMNVAACRAVAAATQALHALLDGAATRIFPAETLLQVSRKLNMLSCTALQLMPWQTLRLDGTAARISPAETCLRVNFAKGAQESINSIGVSAGSPVD